MTRIVILIVFASVIFSGCRKGEEDPFFSFKSRTNRLCGKWRITEMSRHIYVGTDPTFYDKYELQVKGNQGKMYYEGFEVDVYSYIESWEFNRDGTYIINTEVSNIKSFNKGTWTWNGKNKNDEYKKKECVLLKMLSYNYNNGEEVEEYSGNTLEHSYVIALTQLTDKKMSFVTDYSYYVKDSYYQKVKTIAILEKTE